VPPGTDVTVTGIATDPQDFLWVATNQGLFRFDGAHFHRFNSEPLTHVALTSDGWVWAGGPRGLLAIRREQTRKMLTGPVIGLVARGAEIVVSSPQVWQGGIQGLRATGVTANGALASDGQQSVWFGCGLEICKLPVNGPVEQWSIDKGVPREKWIGAIREDNGTVWAWNGPKCVSITQRRAFVRSLWKDPEMRMEAWREPQGRIWIDGPEWIEHGVMRSVGSTPVGSFRQSFASDRHGNIWMGSTRGLALIAGRSWLAGWSTSFPAGAVSVVRTHSLGLLVASRDGARRLIPATSEWKELPGNFQATSTRGILSAANGDTWNLLETRGIIRLDARGRETGSAFRGNFKGFGFRALFRDRQGRLWIGAKRGLYQLDEKTLTLMPVPLPNGATNATTFTSGPDGQEWIGSEAGIARLERGQWKTTIPGTALFNSRIRSIAVGKGPTIWVSYRTDGPLSRLVFEQDRWQRQDLTAVAGYRPNETTALLVDRRGWVWRGTPEGLFVSDGLHFEPARWIHLDRLHNLPSDEISTYGLYEDNDGSIWASTDGGVGHITPTDDWFQPVATDSFPRISALRINGGINGGERLWPENHVTLPRTTSGIELDFACWPAPSANERAIEFRLLPLESEWRMDPSDTARYPALPAGAYRFEIRMAATGEIARYEFQVDAPLFPWWWIPTAAVSVSGGLWLWWRSRFQSEYWTAKQVFFAQPRPEEKSMERIGELLAGRYLLRSRIGDGGFASVYEALDTASSEEVAVKILFVAGELEQHQRRRFERESEALRRIVHPGVVRLLDAGWISEAEPYLVMSYVNGPTLASILRSGPVSRAKTAQWLRQLGAALGETHARGVLHRDLKPENIMIQWSGQPDEHIVVVDFGAAAILERGGLGSLAFGSFPYLAPEQVQGRSSPATDVYSLTAITFEMLTGVRYASLADGTETGLRNALTGFPETVIALLAAGLSYLPSERPGDVRAFAEDLAHSLEG
jgi:ligand-binding sensor domain-containing protein